MTDALKFSNYVLLLCQNEASTKKRRRLEETKRSIACSNTRPRPAASSAARLFRLLRRRPHRSIRARRGYLEHQFASGLEMDPQLAAPAVEELADTGELVAEGLGYAGASGTSVEAFDRDDLVLPEALIERIETLDQVLRGQFDMLWNAVGTTARRTSMLKVTGGANPPGARYRDEVRSEAEAIKPPLDCARQESKCVGLPVGRGAVEPA